MKGKTNISRIFAALILTLTLCLCSAFSASAEAHLEQTGINESFLSDESINSPVFDENVENDTHNSDNSEEKMGNVSQNTGAAEENIFEELYNKICQYATEIISVLTLIGTLIVGFAYKKGLLPLVTRAISAIQGSVNKIKQDTEEGSRCTASGMESLNERLAGVENSLALLSGDLVELSSRLECESECIMERKRMSTVLGAQVDMLYDIFMTSSLPQYQKDATGARIQSMREELAAYESSEKQ